MQNKAKQKVDEVSKAAEEAGPPERPPEGGAEAGQPAEGAAAAAESAAAEGAEAANRRADMTVDGEAVEASTVEVTAADVSDGDAPADSDSTAEEASPAAADDGDAAVATGDDQEDDQEQEEAAAESAADEEDEEEEEDVPVTAEQVTAAGEEAGKGDAAGRDEAEALVADLASVRSEAASYLDDLRRLQADFDNYRKRMLREQTMRVAAASQALVSRLLPVLDNFELAISHAEQSRDFDRMLKGVEMVFGELREVLRTEGLSTIEAEGKPFDPSCHEAVVAVEEEGAEPGTVVDVVRTGYEFQGKVLRPAMVKVAK